MNPNARFITSIQQVKRSFKAIVVLAALAGLAGIGAAQWRHFSDHGEKAEKSASMDDEMVAAHNAVRRKVGVPPLLWSDTLAAVAREWANKLIANGQFEHSRNPRYGENLYEISGGLATPTQVVNDWAGEARQYDYNSNSCHGVCGHYTQIVWHDTTEVGCAVARAGPREVWACEYNPPGNYVGRKPY